MPSKKPAKKARKARDKELDITSIAMLRVMLDIIDDQGDKRISLRDARPRKRRSKR